jgi:hypothetical protein
MTVAGGLGIPPYTHLRPICDTAKWKGADPEFPQGLRRHIRTQVFHYDIQAIDDAQVELYMTADGALSKWLFDGMAWKKQSDYNLRIEGEFLVFDGGRSLVSARAGKWSVVRNFENPVIQIITDRIEGEPLTLIEDKVEQKDFFLHRNMLLDDRGRELFTVRAPRDHSDRLRKVIDFVVTRRPASP